MVDWFMIMQCLSEEGNQFYLSLKLIEDTKIVKFSGVQMLKLCDPPPMELPTLPPTFPKSLTPLKLEVEHAMSY